MTERLKTQVLVVGGGPGGYVAAIRAAQLGLEVVIVETGTLGGVCLARGCIPSKALIHAATEFATVRRAREEGALGIRVTGSVSIDLAETVRWKDGVVEKLSVGVVSLLRRAKVRIETGWGTFVDAKTCHVVRASGATVIVEADHVVLAAGSMPLGVPGLPWGPDVISSTEALSLDHVPERLAIVGAGYIGLELGFAFRKLGSQVTVVEAQDRILAQYDALLTSPVAKALQKEGVAVNLACKAQSFANGRLVVVDEKGGQRELAADKVLVTVGRRPRTEGYGLESMGVDVERGFVVVDDQCRTSMKGVWAIGDLVGEPMLAHKASAQGEIVAESIAGHRRRFAPRAIPAICFTDPEIVTVGVSEAGSDAFKSTTFPLSANGRALSTEAGDNGGFIRVTTREEDHRIVGFAAVGRNVSELSGEMAALIEMGAVLEDIVGIIHAHPTQSEAIREASLRALGQAIHV